MNDLVQRLRKSFDGDVLHRAQLAYETFRGGLKNPHDIPTWDKATSLIRDIAIVAYLQGRLDGDITIRAATIEECAQAFRQFLSDLRHNPSGGDGYPFEFANEMANRIDLIFRAIAEEQK